MQREASTILQPPHVCAGAGEDGGDDQPGGLHADDDNDVDKVGDDPDDHVGGVHAGGHRVGHG